MVLEGLAASGAGLSGLSDYLKEVIPLCVFQQDLQIPRVPKLNPVIIYLRGILKLSDQPLYVAISRVC
jgi:hypothetical protein